MKKSFKTILSCALVSWAAGSQAQTWNFAIEDGFPVTSGSGPSYGTTYDATTSGLLYTCGSFAGSAVFGSTTFTSSGSADAFLTRTNTSTGAPYWTIKAGSTGIDYFKKVETTGADVFVYGTSTSSSVVFNSTSGSPVTLSGISGGFLAKYNNSGVLLWATTYSGGTIVDMAYVASSGRLYTIGVDATNANKTRIKSIKGTTGAVLYDVLSTNTGGSNANKGIAGDASNHCYILVDGTTNFKMPSSPTVTLSVSAMDMVLMRLDTNLTYQKHIKVGNSGSILESAKDVDCSPSGDVYITGSYSGGTTYMDSVSNTPFNLSNGGLSDLFLAKYSTNLVPQWAKKISGAGSDLPIAMSLDPNSDPFLLVQNKATNSVLIDSCSMVPYTSASPGFDNKWYMVKYNRANGSIDWSAAPLAMDAGALPVAVQGLNGSARIVGNGKDETDFGSTAVYGGGFMYYARASKLVCKPAVATGIEENGSENSLTVYPNPTSGLLNIPLSADDKNVQVIITDNLGKQVMKTNNLEANQGTLNIETLPAGIYFYNVIKNNTSYKGKIVKH